MTNKPNIENIVFDVGCVLVDYNPELIVDNILPDTPHREDYLTHLFNTPLWYDLDAGRCTPNEAVTQLEQHLSHIPDYGDNIIKLIDGFVHHLPPIDDSHAMIKSSIQKHPTYILSNFQDEPFDTLLDIHPHLKDVHGTVVSARVKMVKPEYAIYHHLLNTHELDANKTVFIDDLPENIEACRDVGMHGIIFESPEQVRRELKEFGIEL